MAFEQRMNLHHTVTTRRTGDLRHEQNRWLIARRPPFIRAPWLPETFPSFPGFG